MKPFRNSVENFHYVTQNMRPEDRHEVYTMRPDLDDLLVAHEFAAAPWRWIMGDANPIAALAFRPLTPAVLSVSMVATEEFPKIGKSYTRFVRDVISVKMAGIDIHRIEARSIDVHTWAHKWMEVVGGVKEAEMPGVGRNGETYFLFSFTRKE